MRDNMTYQLKDRVKLIETKRQSDTGTIVKLYKGKNGKVRTCGVLWDHEWPSTKVHYRNPPGKVFYYKPEDLKITGTWRLV